MSNISHDYINRYLNGLIPARTGILKELEAYAEANNVPIVTPDVAGLLAVLVKTAGVKRILEVGTAIGYSAILMGAAAGEGFSLTTIEKDPDSAAIAGDNITKAGFSENIKVIVGEAEEALLKVEGSFDMIFVDAAKGQYMEFLKNSIGKLRKGGLFVCDNVLFRGMVAERSLLIRRKITIVKRLKKFLSFISDCENLQTTVIPMGDGVSVSCKLGEVDFDEKA